MVCHHELADPDDDTVHSMLHELLGYLDRNATCMCSDELDTTITVKCLILYLYIFPAESIASSSLSASTRPPGSRPKQCESLGEQAP